MSVTSAKKGKYNIMTTKLAQQKSHCFKLMKPLKLQQKDGEMYSKIEYLDLIFREFKMHDHC